MTQTPRSSCRSYSTASMMSTVHTKHVIRGHSVIPSADCLLYDIGLYLKPVSDRPKPRNLFNSPKVITTILTVYLLERIITLLVTEDHDYYLLLLGDIGRYFKMKQHWNLLNLLMACMALSLQFSFFYGYRRGFEPTFLRVFQVMFQSLPPNTIGLNTSHMKKLTKFKYLVKLMEFNNQFIVPLIAVTFSTVVYYLNLNLIEVLKYGIINCSILCLWLYQVANLVINSTVHFYIICSYLELKLRYLNETIMKQMLVSKHVKRNNRILYTLDALYREIKEYNDTYWSRFLFIVWLFFGSANVLLIYIILYVDLIIVMQFAVLYATIVCIPLFNLV